MERLIPTIIWPHTYIATAPLPVQDVMPTGPVIQNKKVISSVSGVGKYFFAFTESPLKNGVINRSYGCGTGSLPPDTISGLGGLGGLIFRGMPKDAQNEYLSTVPKNAPDSKEPPDEYAPFLRRRGNAMYKEIEKRGNRSGKVAIAFTAKCQIVVGVQADGSDGMSLDDFRDRIIGRGATNGVLLDCSDSACLVYKGRVLAQPAAHKNRASVIGVGFKVNSGNEYTIGVAQTGCDARRDECRVACHTSEKQRRSAPVCVTKMVCSFPEIT